jgi:hypothetical protein
MSELLGGASGLAAKAPKGSIQEKAYQFLLQQVTVRTQEGPGSCSACFDVQSAPSEFNQANGSNTAGADDSVPDLACSASIRSRLLLLLHCTGGCGGGLPLTGATAPAKCVSQ